MHIHKVQGFHYLPFHPLAMCRTRPTHLMNFGSIVVKHPSYTVEIFRTPSLYPGQSYVFDADTRKSVSCSNWWSSLRMICSALFTSCNICLCIIWCVLCFSHPTPTQFLLAHSSVVGFFASNLSQRHSEGGLTLVVFIPV